MWYPAGKAVVISDSQSVGKVRRIPHHLLGHAAYIDAGPAKSIALYDRRAGTVLGSASRARHTAATTTDYQEIKMFSHIGKIWERSALIRAGR